jgi:AraC-like DNA-binding protein
MRPILRKIDAGYGNSFSIREDIFPYLYSHWHYHPEIELTFIRKGEGVRLVGDNREQFQEGDLILLGANLPHVWRSDADYFKGLSHLHVEAIAIQFREDFWGKDFLNLPELKPVKDLLINARRGIKISGKIKARVIAKMEAILKVQGVQRVEYLLNILQLIAQSTDHNFLCSPGFARSYSFTDTDKINLVYTYTFANFQNKIAIRDVAAAVNISQHSFCRYFKSRTLKTYWRFLLEVRVGYACKLLIENEHGVSQICFASGFNNLSNFNRQFRLLTGKTPLQYQKSYLKAGQ